MSIFQHGKNCGLAGLGQWITGAASALLLVSYVVLAVAGVAHHSVLGIPAAAAEHGEHLHGHVSHEPGPAFHGECCSVSACAAVVLQIDGGDADIPPLGSKGFVHAECRLNSVVLAADPPVPRRKTV